ncbi:hypothetical protein [Algoriphagus antarcticus]|nr:hypothetical protein [Algoriphagus antarcticus]
MRSHFKRTIATLSLLTFFAFLPIGCDIFCRNSCGCDGSPPIKRFEVLSFDVQTIDDNGQEQDSDVSYPFNQIFKGIFVGDTNYLSQTVGSKISIPGVAFACDPIPPYAVQQLTSIKIVNIEEVQMSDGSILSIGQDISEYFGIKRNSSYSLSPITTFLDGRFRIYQYENLKIGWLNEPKTELKLKFNIQLVLDTEEEFNFNGEKLFIR